MLRRVALLSITILLPISLCLGQSASSSAPSDAEIRKMLVERIDTQKQSVGIVVGVVDPQGRRIVAYGSLAKDDKRPLNGETVFEIGSMTKVFTSLVLMDMVQRGEVALTDPVSKYLPPEVRVPERGGKKITLADLSTQSSGLPRMPDNFHPKDPLNPYADYSVEQLYQFLSGYTLTRDIGEKYEYSNLGVGLLGVALSRRAGSSYEDMVRSRILKPLKMTNTSISLSPEMKARLATGHNADLKPMPNWDIPTLAGAGALRSTANDMLSFLAANLGFTKTPLAKAMAAEVSVRRPAGGAGVEIAYAWHIFTAHGKTIYWHNGGTGGYRTFMGYDPAARLGIVALSNASTNNGVDDIGHHLLDAEFPLARIEPKTDHKEITVDPKTFDAYTGQYELGPGFALTVTRSGEGLFAQATGQGRFRIFPEGPADFFAKVTELTISFQTDGQGKATALTLRQAGNTTVAKRIGDVKERAAIHVDTKIFDGYVGRYELAPGFIMTVTREGDRLFTQATNQAKFEVFAESERDYFVKEFDARITFQTDDRGKATGIVLHQGGRDMAAKRIE